MLEQILDVPIHSWLEGEEGQKKIVLSSRIRLARNFKDIPFTNLNRQESLEEVNQMMRKILPDLTKVDGREYGNLNLEQLSTEERSILMEKHLISPMLNDNPNLRSLVISDDGSLAIMVNEEDHLRIQAMEGGLNLGKAYDHARRIDDAIEGKYNYAFHEHYGYLTACPTNVGTGLRASVMVHLPAITLTNRISRIVRGIVQLGYTVRGLYGEGSSSVGNIFQISNQITMGISEEKTIEELTKVIEQLVKEEESCRKALEVQDKVSLEDRFYRAFGTLSYARKITGDEALTLLSEYQLGVDMGIIEAPRKYDFNKLIVITRPNFLQKYSGKSGLSSNERDFYRAEIIRDILHT